MTDIREALRYAGVPAPDTELMTRMRGISDRLEKKLRPACVWRVFPLEPGEGGFLLSGSRLVLTGDTAKRMLAGCRYAALMACTLGAPFDTMLRSLQARAMDEALLTDACGSAMVEAVCNDAEKEIAARFPELYLTDRFSPGYGDLSLSLQHEILNTLDAARKAGITLLPSDLMNPSKSVTAVIGISDHPQPARIRGCGYCTMRETCTLRKGGNHCDR